MLHLELTLQPLNFLMGLFFIIHSISMYQIYDTLTDFVLDRGMRQYPRAHHVAWIRKYISYSRITFNIRNLNSILFQINWEHLKFECIDRMETWPNSMLIKLECYVCALHRTSKGKLRISFSFRSNSIFFFFNKINQLAF